MLLGMCKLSFGPFAFVTYQVVVLSQLPRHLPLPDRHHRRPLHLPARHHWILRAKGHGRCPVHDGELQTRH